VSETLTGIVLVATESENAHRPSYFAFGCVRTAVQRKVFYGVLVNTMGRWGGHSEQDVDRGDKNASQWLEMVLWLDGEGPFDDEEFDRVLVAFVDLVAGLLKVHPGIPPPVPRVKKHETPERD
jgi:hypothetical protein